MRFPYHVVFSLSFHFLSICSIESVNVLHSSINQSGAIDTNYANIKSCEQENNCPEFMQYKSPRSKINKVTYLVLLVCNIVSEYILKFMETYSNSSKCLLVLVHFGSTCGYMRKLSTAFRLCTNKYVKMF